MKSTTIASLAVFLLAATTVVSPADAQWGDLKITFKTDKYVAPKDAEGVAAANCGVASVKLEDLVIDEKSLGLANVLVFLDDKGDTPKIHPDYEALAEKKVVLDNIKCRFEPHLATMWTKQTLQIGNKDPVGHNSKVDAFDNTSINPVIPPGGTVDAQFPNAEAVPMTVSCNIHRWMKAYVAVKDHPYLAASGGDGVVTIKKLPAGEVNFRAWHESGYVSDAKINGSDAGWSKGRFTLDIPDGGTAELTVVVPVASLQ